MTCAAFPGAADDRRRAMLRTAMGPAIAAALANPRVIEIMVNPDGALRLDILGQGRVDTGEQLRLWPHIHGTDGFFAAAIEREG